MNLDWSFGRLKKETGRVNSKGLSALQILNGTLSFGWTFHVKTDDVTVHKILILEVFLVVFNGLILRNGRRNLKRPSEPRRCRFGIGAEMTLTLSAFGGEIGSMEKDDIRLCVFCGSYADSKEHVFALRLCERADAKKFAVVTGLFVEGQEPKMRPKQLVQNFTVRHVCKNCNNKWMNDLEAWFEDKLGLLIEPHWPKDALPIIEALKSERGKLAQWLMKTAVMFSCACVKGGKNPVEFSPEVTRKIKEGILPKNLWADLAYSNVATLAGGLTRNFRAKIGNQIIPDAILKNEEGFRFCIQYNHLLLRIAQAPAASFIYQSSEGEYPVRLYPEPSKIPEKITYQDVMKFEHSVILEF